MKKLIISALALSVIAAAPAHAINAHYRDQLIRSGCTQVTESQGCDIHKTKAQNAAAGFGKNAPTTSHQSIEKFAGSYVAKFSNGQRVAGILIGGGTVEVEGKTVKAEVVDDMLIIKDRTIIYNLFTNGTGTWEDTDAGNHGVIRRG